MEGIIVGGGIIGLSIARELLKAGHKITILEKDTIGKGASWTAGGMLAPQSEGLKPDLFFDFCIQSRDMYPQFVEELEKETGTEVSYWDCGILCPAYSYEEAGELQKNMEMYKEVGLPGEWWDRSKLEKKYPHIGKSIVGGVFYPEDGQVDNRLLMESLTKSVKQLGAKVLENTTALKILGEDSFEGVETNRGILQGDYCIVSAGAWSSYLLDAKVYPMKGQMMAVDIDPSDIDTVFFGSKAYLIPRKDYSRMVIGATEELVGFTEGNTPEGLLQLSSGLKETMPPLAHRKVQEIWYGYRPATPDLLPVLGKTDREGVFIASGHHRNGILLAPITAKVMADLILKGVESPYLQHFSVNRFKGM
ncbi:MAG: glycine oxidase ThiO [Aquificae bacterium]|nr:glycine oxidase ThiO [Aquificota bacterium]